MLPRVQLSVSGKRPRFTTISGTRSWSSSSGHDAPFLSLGASPAQHLTSRVFLAACEKYKPFLIANNIGSFEWEAFVDIPYDIFEDLDNGPGMRSAEPLLSLRSTESEEYSSLVPCGDP